MLFCGIYIKAISQDVRMNIIRNMCLKITYLKLLPHLTCAATVTTYKTPQSSRGRPGFTLLYRGVYRPLVGWFT